MIFGDNPHDTAAWQREPGCICGGLEAQLAKERERSASDRRVLAAMWAIPDGTLNHALNGDHWVKLPGSIVDALRAEQARRSGEGES